MSAFLAPWRAFFQHATDASHDYTEAAGLAALSTIALGKTVVNLGSGVLPNLYLMLVGESSVARKSTSVRYAQRIVNEVLPGRVGPGSWTIAGLRQWMKSKDENTGRQKTKFTIFAGEFATALDAANQFDLQMPSTMCTLYDGDDWREARATGAFVIEKPQVGIFTAAAYAMLSKRVTTNDWESGFMLRFLFVEPKHPRPAFAKQPPHPASLWDAAVTGLRHVLFGLEQLQRPMVFEPAAEQAFEAIVQSYGTAAAAADDSILPTYIGRFSVMVAKLAMLYQLDANVNAPISMLAVQQAASIAALSWDAFVRVRKETTKGEWEGVYDTVLAMLRQHGSRSFRKDELWSQLGRSRMLPSVWNYLMQTGALVEDPKDRRNARVIGSL